VFVIYYALVLQTIRWCGVDVLSISHVCVLREALVTVLQGAGENQARSAFSHETVAAALVEGAPSLVVIDASHPEATALVAAVRAQGPKTSVIVLAMCERDEDFLAWADIGISGYLGPDTSADDLLSAVRRVGAGEVACPPRLTALLLNRFADRSTERTTRAGIFSLTTREREVAELLADGLSNKLIARRLQVALPTVKNHVHSILDKWDCRSRGEAAARYRQQIGNDVKPSGGTVVALRASHMSKMGGATVRNGSMQHRVSAATSHKAA
jgi:DNA-binding NarL/FixJ family response regulator